MLSFGALAADTAPPIPRAYLFGNPQRYYSNISPDAQWLSWLAPLNGVMNLWVAPLDHPDNGRPVTHETGRGISILTGSKWTYDGRHILLAINTQLGFVAHRDDTGIPGNARE